MSQKLKRKASNRKSKSSARQPVRYHDLRPGNIVWLPQSAIKKSKMIRQFEHHSNRVESAEIGKALREEAYNHPVVVLEVMNFPSRHSNSDDYVVVSMLTSFGSTAECENTCLLQTRRTLIWHSYLAIHPCKHPSRPDFQVLYLQKGKLEKPSYIRLERIYMPISVLKTYRQGRTATASDIYLTSQSLDILLREVGIKAPQSSERGPGTVARATTAIPPSPSLPVLSTQARPLKPPRMPHRPQIVVSEVTLGESETNPSRRGATVMPSSPSLAIRSFADNVSLSHNIPARPQISAREDALPITNAQRLSRSVPLSHIRDNHGSIDDRSLPPPVTWNSRGHTSMISRISNNIGRTNFLRCLMVALCLLILGLIFFKSTWASIVSSFTKNGHSFTLI